MMKPLHDAIAQQQSDLVLRLVKEGSDVNEEDENGWTPMQIACQKGNVEIVKIL